ncbi:hypothetical protein LZ023_38285 (plasmid) [Pseudomonas silvicola]|nr:hypothetical protein LZ023_38285 [Pseudomonas silvicola]
MQKPGVRVRQHQLSREMRMVQSDYWPVQALCESSQPANEQPQLVLTFGVQGESRFRESNGREIAFSAGHLTVTSFQASQGERLYRAGERVQQVRLILQCGECAPLFLVNRLQKVVTASA